jgi:hypothetical protein
MEKARRTGKRLPTAGLTTSVRLARPGDFDAFVEDLGRAVADVVARYHTEAGEGRSFRVMAGAYPAGGDPPGENTGVEHALAGDDHAMDDEEEDR